MRHKVTSELCAMVGVRPRGVGSIYKRGNIYWIAYVDRRGRQHCESSRLKGVRPGTNYNDAKRLLAEREGKIAEGVPVTPDTSKFTFDNAAQLVIDNYVRKERRSLADMQRRLDKHLTPHFGTLRMTEITSDVIDAFVAARKKAKAGNGEINRELAIEAWSHEEPPPESVLQIHYTPMAGRRTSPKER